MDCLRIFVFCVFFSSVLTDEFDEEAVEHFRTNSMKLQDWLMRDGKYRKNTRPSLRVSVGIYFNLVALGGFDVINGQLKSVGTILLHWSDTRLSWNAYDYNGTYLISFMLHEVWRPQISIYNPLDKFHVIDRDNENNMVWYMDDGSALFMVGGTYSTTCNPDIKYFPYDVHECSIIFIPFDSMIFDSSIKNNSITIFDAWYKANPDLRRDDVKWLYRTLTPCIVHLKESDGFNAAAFPIRIERRSSFIFVNVILPILLLGFMNISVFVIPVQAGERISFSITVLLSFTVFMIFISDVVPEASDPMPVLSYFLVFKLAYSACISVAIIIVTRLFHRDEKDKVSYAIQRLVILVEHVQRCCKREIKQHKTTTSNAESMADGKENCCGEQTAEKKSVSWERVSYAFDKIFLSAFLMIIISETVLFLLVISHQFSGGSDSLESKICTQNYI